MYERFLTIFDIAVAKGVPHTLELIDVTAFGKLGLSLFSGCETCNQTLAIQDAYPTLVGTVRCRAHINENGIVNIAAYDAIKAAA